MPDPPALRIWLKTATSLGIVSGFGFADAEAGRRDAREIASGLAERVSRRPWGR
jgi:hypothetical protein